MDHLIQKYNVPGPRYTSYPTVPYWEHNNLNQTDWKKSVRENYFSESDRGISIYIHLPFCESLCTFCGCHKRITKNHNVENPYIETLLKEWKLYTAFLGENIKISEIHLGGGTPTFFAPEKLVYLIESLKNNSVFSEDIELSIEAHPNNTTKEHLSLLHQIGFQRISFGIQDYDPKVQKTINRVQSFEQVKKVHDWAREIGYESISHDLVYGLPFQTIDSIKNTIELTVSLSPDRLSFYSYGHVPWVKGLGQRGYSEDDLPEDNEKRALYEYGKESFEENGFFEVGMDHFAQKSDSLFTAQEKKSLHRNFMGYTTTDSKLMIGLGMSSISDSWGAFAQNSKSVEEYQNLVSQDIIPVFRGHILSNEDLIVRQLILDLMCKFEAKVPKELLLNEHVDFDMLRELEKDGICSFENETVCVSELGKTFIRNICMCFDVKLNAKKMNKPTFSKTI